MIGPDSLLSSDGFMPHGMCYLWRPDILGLHVASDLLIAVSYFTIPFTLLYFVRRRRDIPFNWMVVCFAIFIVACGTTHLMEIVVIWHPLYWLSGGIKAVTALASVPTAILLARLVPAALRLPSPESLREANEKLRLAYESLRSDAARGRLAAIVDSSDDAIISKTTEGIITSWNPGATRIFGYTEAEAIGRPATILFPADKVAEEAQILARVGRGERVPHFESVRIRKNGTRVDVSASISPIRDDDGKIVGASKIARDITDRKRTEETIREQIQVLDLAQVLVRDLNGRIVLWNAGAEKLYDFSQQEALGRVSHELLQTQFPEPLEQIESKLAATGKWEGELIHRRRDGAQLAVASVWVVHRDLQGNPRSILESNTDVTERRSAEQKAVAQLARLHLLNSITRAIGDRHDLASIFQVVAVTLQESFRVDLCCICLHVPPNTQITVTQLSTSSEQLRARLGLSVDSRIDIDQNGLSYCVRGELVYEPDLTQTTFAFPRRLADAGICAFVATPLIVENKVFGVLIAARRAVRSFSSGECEFLQQLSEHVALAVHQSNLRSALQTAYDDLRQTQDAVMRQEKLRVLGQMASGIAHDINNALSPATLYTEALLERDSGLTGDARKSLVVVRDAIEGVARTVARMKDFYSQRDSHTAYSPVNLNRILEQVVELTRVRWSTMPQESGFTVEVEYDLAADMPEIFGAESDLRDAFTNLILNAVDAMPKGGKLTLRSRVMVPDQVEVEFIDTGIGMDEATRTRCLELFFTTKGERGTGLGLAMVYGMIERHGGELEIDSEPGRGTTIRLFFPLTAVPAGATATTLEQLKPAPPSRILVIDDDPIVLKSLSETLENDGHSVTVAAGGESGIATARAAKESGTPFDIVITDLGMPHVDGNAVAAAIKSATPDVQIVLLTGWGHRMLADHHLPPNIDRVLSKPPRLAALRVALAELTTESAS